MFYTLRMDEEEAKWIVELLSIYKGMLSLAMEKWSHGLTLSAQNRLSAVSGHYASA